MFFPLYDFQEPVWQEWRSSKNTVFKPVEGSVPFMDIRTVAGLDLLDLPDGGKEIRYFMVLFCFLSVSKQQCNTAKVSLEIFSLK